MLRHHQYSLNIVATVRRWQQTPEGGRFILMISGIIVSLLHPRARRDICPIYRAKAREKRHLLLHAWECRVRLAALWGMPHVADAGWGNQGSGEIAGQLRFLAQAAAAPT